MVSFFSLNFEVCFLFCLSNCRYSQFDFSIGNFQNLLLGTCFPHLVFCPNFCFYQYPLSCPHSLLISSSSQSDFNLVFSFPLSLPFFPNSFHSLNQASQACISVTFLSLGHQFLQFLTQNSIETTWRITINFCNLKKKKLKTLG